LKYSNQIKLYRNTYVVDRVWLTCTFLPYINIYLAKEQLS